MSEHPLTTRRSSVKINNQNIDLILTEGTITPNQRKIVTKAVCSELQAKQLKSLIDTKDQGRVFSLISKSPASNHWVGTGNFTSFAAYRFGIKARCNLLPTRTVIKRQGRTVDVTCPKCSQQPETLAQVQMFILWWRH